VVVPKNMTSTHLTEFSIFKLYEMWLYELYKLCDRDTISNRIIIGTSNIDSNTMIKKSGIINVSDMRSSIDTAVRNKSNISTDVMINSEVSTKVVRRSNVCR